METISTKNKAYKSKESYKEQQKQYRDDKKSL